MNHNENCKDLIQVESKKKFLLYFDKDIAKEYLLVLIEHLKSVNPNDFTFTPKNYKTTPIVDEHYKLLYNLTYLGFIERIGVEKSTNKIRYKLLKPLYADLNIYDNIIIQHQYECENFNNPIFETYEFLNLRNTAAFIFKRMFKYIDSRGISKYSFKFSYEYFVELYNSGITFYDFTESIKEIISYDLIDFFDVDYFKDIYKLTEFTRRFIT